MGFGFVRRPTGGRAVLHDKELTYSITIAYPNRILEMNLLDSYHFLSSGIIKAIEYIGLKAHFSRNEDKNFSTPSCFSLPHFSDIVINDKKVVGSAQMRNKFGLLQHGSILYDVSIEDIFNCFRMDEEERKQSIEEGYSKITSLSKELGKKVDFYIIKQALKVGFREVFNEEIIETQITPFELEIAYNLYENSIIVWNGTLENRGEYMGKESKVRQQRREGTLPKVNKKRRTPRWIKILVPIIVVAIILTTVFSIWGYSERNILAK